jgi:hypothetical protein
MSPTAGPLALFVTIAVYPAPAETPPLAPNVFCPTDAVRIGEAANSLGEGVTHSGLRLNQVPEVPAAVLGCSPGRGVRLLRPGCGW